MSVINDITFEVGYKCNSNCTYCFQKNRKYQTEILPVDSAVSLIKNLEKEDRLAPDFKIMIFGGEPLLFMDWIKEFIAKIERKYPVRITTNGALLSEDTIQDLVDLDIKPTISVDGGFLTQEVCRGESLAQVEVFQRIKNAIELIKRNGLSPTCQSTFVPGTIGRLFETYLFIRHLGFSQWWYELENLSEVGSGKWTKMSLNIYKSQLQEVLKFQKISPRFRLLNLDFLIDNMKPNRYEHNRIYVDIYGNITYSAVGILRLGNENADLIKIGSIEQGIDFEKMEKKIPPICNSPVCPSTEECNSCKLNQFCILDDSHIGAMQDVTNCKWWKILWEAYDGLR